MCVIHCICMCVHVRVHTCVIEWQVRVHASRHPFFSMVGLVVYAYNHVQWPGRAIPYHCWPGQARPGQAGRQQGLPTCMQDTHKCTHIHGHTSVHTKTQLDPHRSSHTSIWGGIHTCSHCLSHTCIYIERQARTRHEHVHIYIQTHVITPKHTH